MERAYQKAHAQGNADYSKRFSISATDAQNWKEVISQLESKTLQLGKLNRVLGRTPAVLQMLGENDRPLMIDSGVLYKVAYGERNDGKNGHFVPVSELAKLPYELDDPIAVFQSETQRNALVIMTALKEKGRNVLVALHMDRRATGRILIHNIRSVYGKESVSAINDWVKHGMLLYVNQTKNRSLPRGTRVQFPIARLAKNGRSAFKTEEDLISFVENAPTIAQSGSAVNKNLARYSIRSPFSRGNGYLYTADGTPIESVNACEARANGLQTAHEISQQLNVPTELIEAFPYAEAHHVGDDYAYTSFYSQEALLTVPLFTFAREVYATKNKDAYEDTLHAIRVYTRPAKEAHDYERLSNLAAIDTEGAKAIDERIRALVKERQDTLNHDAEYQRLKRISPWARDSIAYNNRREELVGDISRQIDTLKEERKRLVREAQKPEAQKQWVAQRLTHAQTKAQSLINIAAEKAGVKPITLPPHNPDAFVALRSQVRALRGAMSTLSAPEGPRYSITAANATLLSGYNEQWLYEMAVAYANTDPTKGRVVAKDRAFEISDTPLKLKALGLEKAKIFTKAYVVRKLARKHDIAPERFAKLPQYYADPVMVLREKYKDGDGYAYIVLTKMLAKDEDGRIAPVMVYLEPNQDDAYLSSAYARTVRGERKYKNLLRTAGAVLYIDKKAALQLPLQEEARCSINTFNEKGDSKVKTPENFRSLTAPTIAQTPSNVNQKTFESPSEGSDADNSTLHTPHSTLPEGSSSPRHALTADPFLRRDAHNVLAALQAERILRGVKPFSTKEILDQASALGQRNVDPTAILRDAQDFVTQNRDTQLADIARKMREGMTRQQAVASAGALYPEDVTGLSNVTLNREIYGDGTGGMAPDEVAQALYNDGTLRDYRTDAMWDTLRSEIERYNGAKKALKDDVARQAYEATQAALNDRLRTLDWLRENETRYSVAATSDNFSGDIPIISLKSSNFDDLKKVLKPLLSKTFTNESTGIKATFTGRTLKEATNAKETKKSVATHVNLPKYKRGEMSEAQAKDFMFRAHIAALENVDRLFAQAREHSIENGKTPEIAFYHRFYQDFMYDGETLRAKIGVKEFADSNEGNKIYTVQSLKIIQQSANTAQSSLHVTNASSPADAYNIAQPDTNVNHEPRYSVSGLYSGSPVPYTQPSLHAVGTGENAHVYGYGLYASNKYGVARSYADERKEEDNNKNLSINGQDYIWMQDMHDWSGIWDDGNVDFTPYIEAIVDKDIVTEIDTDFLNDVFWWPEKDLELSKEQWLDSIEEKYGEGAELNYARALAESVGFTSEASIQEQTWWTHRAPGDESHLIEWTKRISKENATRILTQLQKELGEPGERDELSKMIRVLTRGILPTGEQLYNHLNLIFAHEYEDTHTFSKRTSEFLYRAGIDGVKYPVDATKGYTDYEHGANYVAFSDEHLQVDHQWQWDGVNYAKRFSVVSAYVSGQPLDAFDLAYLETEARGDREGAQNLVRAYAKNAALRRGEQFYEAYHGTQSFGFTVFDPQKSDDGRSLFFADSPVLASTYSDVGGVKEIGRGQSQHLQPLAQRYADGDYETEGDILYALANEVNLVPELEEEFDGSNIIVFKKGENTVLRFDLDYEENILQQINAIEETYVNHKQFIEASHDSYAELRSAIDAHNQTALPRDEIFVEFVPPSADGALGSELKVYLGGEYTGISFNGETEALSQEELEYIHTQLVSLLYRRTIAESMPKGNYHVGLFFKNPLIVTPQNGNNTWRNIESGNLILESGKNAGSTREWAKYAKDNGYDGVIFKQIRDFGGYSWHNDDKPHDVYIAFNAEQAKSLDPFTYDDTGVLIPLSQRFDDGRRDARFSIVSKEGYWRKMMYAQRRNQEDKDTVTTLTEEQHDALAELAGLRHEMHSRITRLLENSDRSNDIANHFGEVINKLEELGLDTSALPYIDSTVTPESTDIYDEDIDGDYEEYYERIVSEGYRWWENINTQIEKFLGAIDDEHGTHYKPGGYTRFSIGSWKDLGWGGRGRGWNAQANESNNATYAREDGKKPLKEWSREDFATAARQAGNDPLAKLIEAKNKIPLKTLRERYLDSDNGEWHHILVGDYYVETEFFFLLDTYERYERQYGYEDFRNPNDSSASYRTGLGKSLQEGDKAFLEADTPEMLLAVREWERKVEAYDKQINAAQKEEDALHNQWVANGAQEDELYEKLKEINGVKSPSYQLRQAQNELHKSRPRPEKLTFPERRFSVVSVGKTNVVLLDRLDEIAKINLKDKASIAAYLKNIIGKEFNRLPSGEVIKIGKELPNEYTRGRASKGDSSRKSKAKAKLATGIDEAIIISGDAASEPTKHKAREGGVYYRRSFKFAIKKGYNEGNGFSAYDAELLTYTAKGVEYLYDVVNIKDNPELATRIAEIGTSRVNSELSSARNTISNQSLNVNQKTFEFPSDRSDARFSIGSPFSRGNGYLYSADGTPIESVNAREARANGLQTAYEISQQLNLPTELIEAFPYAEAHHVGDDYAYTSFYSQGALLTDPLFTFAREVYATENKDAYEDTLHAIRVYTRPAKEAHDYERRFTLAAIDTEGAKAIDDRIRALVKERQDTLNHDAEYQRLKRTSPWARDSVAYNNRREELVGDINRQIDTLKEERKRLVREAQKPEAQKQWVAQRLTHAETKAQSLINTAAEKAGIPPITLAPHNPDAFLERRFSIASTNPNTFSSTASLGIDFTKLPESLNTIATATKVSFLTRNGHKDTTHQAYIDAGEYDRAEAYARELAQSSDPKTAEKGHYILAKYHDNDEAAQATIERVLKLKKAGDLQKAKPVLELREKLDPNRPVVFVPVINTETNEAEGKKANALPYEYAGLLSNVFNAVVDDNIRKVSGGHNTNATAEERAAHVLEFVGDVEALPENAQIVLVDDTYTTGSTLAHLYAYIKSLHPEADIRAIATLAFSRYGKSFALTEDGLNRTFDYAKIAPETFKDITGYEPVYFTGAQHFRNYFKHGSSEEDLRANFVQRRHPVYQSGNLGEAWNRSRSRVVQKVPLNPRFAVGSSRVNFNNAHRNLALSGLYYGRSPQAAEPGLISHKHLIAKRLRSRRSLRKREGKARTPYCTMMLSSAAVALWSRLRTGVKASSLK